MRHPRGHRCAVAGHRRRRRSPVSIVAALLLLALVVAAVRAPMTLLVVGPLLMMALPLALVACVVLGVRQVARVAGRPAVGPVGAAPVPPPRPDVAWERARRRFDALRAEYAAHECDPMAVLRLPALSDVGVPSTGRFVEAFAEAQALETDERPPRAHAAAFAAAADRAERAWRAAVDAAERIRLSRLSPAERGTVERAIKLLTTARDSDNDAERLAAYARARTELAKLDRAGVVHLPRPAAAALDAAARGALPG